MAALSRIRSASRCLRALRLLRRLPPRALPPRPLGGNAPNPWQVSGYQFDLNSGNNYTGQLYEGQGRGIVNSPGGIVQLLPSGQNIRIGVVTDNPAQFIYVKHL
jgi:hypothetical protein